MEQNNNNLLNEYKYMGNRLLSNLLTLLKVFLFLLVVFAISISIVYPLWTIATTNKILYSKIVLLTIGSLLSLFLLFKMVSYVITNGITNFFKLKVLSFFKKFFSILIITILLLFALSLQSVVLNIIALLFVFVIIFIFAGYFKFAKKK